MKKIRNFLSIQFSILILLTVWGISHTLTFEKSHELSTLEMSLFLYNWRNANITNYCKHFQFWFQICDSQLFTYSNVFVYGYTFPGVSKEYMPSSFMQHDFRIIQQIGKYLKQTNRTWIVPPVKYLFGAILRFRNFKAFTLTSFWTFAFT